MMAKMIVLKSEPKHDRENNDDDNDDDDDHDDDDEKYGSDT